MKKTLVKTNTPHGIIPFGMSSRCVYFDGTTYRLASAGKNKATHFILSVPNNNQLLLAQEGKVKEEFDVPCGTILYLGQNGDLTQERTDQQILAYEDKTKGSILLMDIVEKPTRELTFH